MNKGLSTSHDQYIISTYLIPHSSAKYINNVLCDHETLLKDVGKTLYSTFPLSTSIILPLSTGTLYLRDPNVSTDVTKPNGVIRAVDTELDTKLHKYSNKFLPLSMMRKRPFRPEHFAKGVTLPTSAFIYHEEFNIIWWSIMMTSASGNFCCVTGLLWGETTGHRWIPLTKANDADLWCFFWSTPEQTVEQTVDLRHCCTYYDVTVLILTLPGFAGFMKACDILGR